MIRATVLVESICILQCTWLLYPGVVFQWILCFQFSCCQFFKSGNYFVLVWFQLWNKNTRYFWLQLQYIIKLTQHNTRLTTGGVVITEREEWGQHLQSFQTPSSNQETRQNVLRTTATKLGPSSLKLKPKLILKLLLPIKLVTVIVTPDVLSQQLVIV